ncbi:MAG: RNA 3'-terminal phosphate cyclase [Polyangiales bacterium]
MIELDGSMGEGGGQVLRSSLALSMLTGKALRLRRVRAGRPKPGLRPQHLVALRAAASVCFGAVEGDRVGSSEVAFYPGAITAGDYDFDIGTAGSSTLVFQTVLPALALTPAPSTLRLTGGTHNPMAPTYDFLERVYLPVLARMGLRCELTFERHGFYPAGGGRWGATVHGVSALRPISITTRGALRDKRIVARVAGVGREVASRELSALRAAMGWGPEVSGLAEKLDAREGPGNVVFVELACEHATELFAGLGERGVTAETVARRVADEARAWLEAEVPVGEHLCDQLMLPMALAGGGEFLTTAPSLHSTTHAEVIREFLGTEVRFEAVGEGRWRVTLRGDVVTAPTRGVP